MNRFLKKQKENGLIADSDFLVKGNFVLSAGDIGGEILKTILIAIFTLGMVIRTASAKSYYMAIGSERLMLFVDGRPFEILREEVSNITINKQTKRGLSITINLVEGEPMNLFAKPFNKQTTVEQLKNILA